MKVPSSLLLFGSLLSLVIAAPAPQAATSTVSTPAGASAPSTFYSAPNTFTPTATGDSQINGATVTITNTAGAGSYSDTFVYTAAASSVKPTGNFTVTNSATASNNNLQPDPKNLQTAGATRTVNTPLFFRLWDKTAICTFGLLFVGVLVGGGGVFA
ncbi:hypothetical protein T439DRAFT_382638 [Meredithblackwellia eburnea MCA 4105]